DPRKDPNRGIKMVDWHALYVTFLDKGERPPPLRVELGAGYLPQATGYLLPRLLPLDHPDTYMFFTYVSASRKVMARYLDVGQEQDVPIMGKKVRAVLIRDKIGLEGSVTIHYVSPKGAYLGSYNADNKVMILPSDKETLLKLWENPELTAPG